MLKMKAVFSCILITVLICFTVISNVQAITTDVNPFPIGVYWTPSPENTTAEKYQEIKDMNATYVLMGNGVDETSENDAALALCADKGLKGIITEKKMLWYEMPLEQPVNGSGSYVSQNNSLGQTFTTPSASVMLVDKINLWIDRRFWPSGVTLTLSVYDSPSKTGLIGRSSITGPVATDFPVFSFGKWLTPNTSYYMELTSDSAANIGWVARSASNSYNGGTSYEHGTSFGYDFWFKIELGHRMYIDGTQPFTADLDSFANHYKTNAALLGYNIIDEPNAKDMTYMQSTIERLRQEDPSHMTYVNLYPSYVSLSELGFGTPSGEFVTPNRALGQTFRTNSNTTLISTIQLYIDKNQWNTSEPLTLKLWNSSAKTTLLGQTTIAGSSNEYPQFVLNTAVSPNTTYYWELTHGGGGDNSVGWVVKSSDGIEWEKDGTAYAAGTVINGDFWFTINQNITAWSYEDYVYRWVSKNPDFLMYDHYPFKENGTMTADYYTNMEIVRRQALKASVDFWTYIQSIGITGNLRSPNQNELRYQIYTSLAYGAKGINYFTYTTPASQGESFHDGIILPNGTKGPLYTYAQGINAEVLKLGPTLKTLTSQVVYHTGTLPDSTTALPSNYFWKPSDINQPLVIGYFKNSSERKYIMVVNRDYTASRTVSFVVSPKPTSVKEVSKTTGTEADTNYNPSTGTLSATFAPGEGKLYAFPTGY